jgi:hypothetical protein
MQARLAGKVITRVGLWRKVHCWPPRRALSFLPPGLVHRPAGSIVSRASNRGTAAGSRQNGRAPREPLDLHFGRPLAGFP